MVRKKLLLASLSLIIIPLLLITTLENTPTTPEKINMIVKNIYQCYDLPKEKRQKCYLLNLNTKLSIDDNFAIIKKIEKDMETNKKIKSACHELTHNIGSAAYTNYGVRALESGFASCGEGYYHGIMSDVLINKTNGADILAKFCLDSSNNIRALGLCYHGIGHSIINNINTNNDKEFLGKILKECATLKEEKNLKIVSAALVEKKLPTQDNEISELIHQSCFIGGFDEYLHEKINKENYTPGQININICDNIDIYLIKDCSTSVYYTLIAEQVLDPTLSIDDIFHNFSRKCDSLPSLKDVEIRAKEGCFKAISRNYINSTLMGDSKFESRNISNIFELPPKDIYSKIRKVCNLDYNMNCTLWFLLEVNEKLIPSEFDKLLSNFEKITLEDIKQIK